jgi:hypothetical protein
MTSGKSKSVYLTTAILIATMTAAAQSPNASRALEGAWNVSIVFDQSGLPPCAPAPTIVIATAPNWGTIIADSCYASESAGYGVWVRTGHNQFAITFRGNSFNAAGTVETSYEVRATVSLGNSNNVFAGPFQTRIFDLGGNVIQTFTGSVNGLRIGITP